VIAAWGSKKPNAMYDLQLGPIINKNIVETIILQKICKRQNFIETFAVE